MHVIHTLGPVVLIVAAGALLRRFGFAGRPFFDEANRLVYWVGLPALLFHKTSTAVLSGGSALRVALLVLGGTAVSLALAVLAAWFWKIPRPSRGALYQGAFRGNLAFAGLPVILFSLTGRGGAGDVALEAAAVLALAPVIPMYNVLSVIVLLWGRHAGVDGVPAHPWRRMAVGVVTNPLVLSCLAGLAVSVWAVTLPPWFQRTASALGQMALPIALLSIGAALSFEALRGRATACAIGALIKVAVAPLAGLALARVAGIGGTDLHMALIYLACPTAVASYVMTRQLRGAFRSQKTEERLWVLGTGCWARNRCRVSVSRFALRGYAGHVGSVSKSNSPVPVPVHVPVHDFP
jgi:malate permease and related proteins